MVAESGGRSGVHVANLVNQYLLPRGHPAPQRVRTHLDRVVRRELPAELARSLGAIRAPGDQSLWFIRHLDVRFSTQVDWERGRTAMEWSNAIVGALVRELRRGGDNVLYFPDRASYLGRFVVDLAGGRAWGKWFYRRFRGLRPLPAPGAVRTALLADPDLGVRALAGLPMGDVRTMLRALDPPEASRILNGLGNSGEPATPSQVRTAWRSVRMSGYSGPLPASTDPEVRALELFIMALTSGSAMHRGQLRTAARARADLDRLPILLGNDEKARKHVLQALTAGRWPMLARWLDPSSVPGLRGILDCPVGERAAFMGVTHSGSPSGDVVPDVRDRRTPFGGLFLLMPHLDGIRLPPHETAGPGRGTGAPDAMRFAVLCRCLGQTLSRAVFADPVLRDLLRIDPELSERTLHEWLKEVTKRLGDGVEDGAVIEDFQASESTFYFGDGGVGRTDPSDIMVARTARQVLRTFSAGLHGFQESTPEFLVENFLAMPATIEEEDTRLVVRLGRAPLTLVLSMAGVTRRDHRLHWLGGRSLSIFSEA